MTCIMEAILQDAVQEKEDNANSVSWSSSQSWPMLQVHGYGMGRGRSRSWAKLCKTCPLANGCVSSSEAYCMCFECKCEAVHGSGLLLRDCVEELLVSRTRQN